MPFTDHERQLLRTVALESIEFGLVHRCELPVAALDYPASLRVATATFVTLRSADELLGCIGTLRPSRPLVCDVAHNAYHAAFGDPRFAPLTAAQLSGLDLHVSVLSPLECLAVRCEDDLIDLLRPGVDGVVIEEGTRVATFLPTMWPRLGDPRTFVRLLKEKGNWPPGYWSTAIMAYRYTVENI
jgi:AmmeMemoRadiSam system protein A